MYKNKLVLKYKRKLNNKKVIKVKKSILYIK